MSLGQSSWGWSVLHTTGSTPMVDNLCSPTFKVARAALPGATAYIQNASGWLPVWDTGCSWATCPALQQNCSRRAAAWAWASPEQLSSAPRSHTAHLTSVQPVTSLPGTTKPGLLAYVLAAPKEFVFLSKAEETKQVYLTHFLFSFIFSP